MITALFATYCVFIIFYIYRYILLRTKVAVIIFVIIQEQQDAPTQD
jgi:hypothetical protein